MIECEWKEEEGKKDDCKMIVINGRRRRSTFEMKGEKQQSKAKSWKEGKEKKKKGGTF